MAFETRMEPVQRRFAERCDQLLQTMVEQAHKEDTWDIYLSKGAGDRAIAGDHEERHLLELLQNARDAVYRGRLEGDTSPGRVFVAVTERGMVMANTGAPFRLDNEDVLKAVRFLMRSDKAGKGFIGHKGIGLKSILLRAGAFSVQSRIGSEVLRATFSRYRAAKYLLDSISADPTNFPDERRMRILAELPRMPLFTQPHADPVDREPLGSDTQLVEALLGKNGASLLGLSNEGHPSSIKTFTTVVYLPYCDEEWEPLLDSVERIVLQEQEPDSLQAFRRAREQMGTISKEAGADATWRELSQLDPRVLVLLGEITEIQFARFHGGELTEACRIDIDQPLSPLSSPKRASIEKVRLRVSQWSESAKTIQPPQCRTLVVLSAPTQLGVEGGDHDEDEGPAEYIRILLEAPASDKVSLKDEPFFLYYPIEASQSELPFIIHGPFRVNSSRTALVPSQQDHNRQVLKEAVDLLSDRLDTLLKPESPLRKWLPWILLPLADPEGETATGQEALQRELAEWIVDLLRKKRCVPTSRGIRRPEQVHFFPARPDALSLLEGLKVGRRKMSSRFYLLERDNRATYQRLYANARDRWVRAAHSIGLGRIDLLSFAEDLGEHMGRVANDKPLFVDAGSARIFFLNLSALFGEAESSIACQAAEIIGQNGVPFLPAYSSNAEGMEDREELLLVPAEARREIGEAMSRQASRVVFWRPSSIKTRTGDLPSPPSVIPVYFIDPSVVEAEGARVEGVLSTYYDEWGTTRFESRPDLFRRVADRAAQLSNISVLPVLGYLAGLLHLITSESFSGAEDLRPRPYATIDIVTLWNSLHLPRPRGQRFLDRQRLESAQLWAQIQVPIQGKGQSEATAESAVFGLEWAEVLEQGAPAVTEGEDTSPELAWAKAIRSLASFRDSVGRTADDDHWPELAVPEDPRWDPARQQLRRAATELTPEQETLALFQLLLLFGVRIGPRMEWRWLDNRGQADGFDAKHRAINLEVSRQVFEIGDLPDNVFPHLLSQSQLLQAYSRHISIHPYHAAFSGDHSWGCREDLRQKVEVVSRLRLAAWIWLPDLMGADLGRPPFNGDRATADAFRKALIAAWPELTSNVLRTGWYCSGWHAGRSWRQPIPSLAAFQLSRLDLWQARPGGRLADVENRRFPACVMVAWDGEDPPSVTEPAGFFPLLDTRDEQLSRVARDLGVVPLSDLSFPGAVTRLRWLLEESRVGDGSAGCWEIAEFEGTSRDAWLAAQYRLLDRVVHRDPTSKWDQHTVLTCGLALRTVRGEQQWAVPIITNAERHPQFAMDVAFFPLPPRIWEREANADRWILETQRQLQTALYRWAEALGATRLPPTDPPAYKGVPVEDPEAVAPLQKEVQNRLVLLLGAFKAHRAEKLDEMAQRVLGALSEMYPAMPDTGERSWSGLDGQGRLVFSIRDYRAEERAGRSGAAVLAEGLALLVEQTTAVGDLGHALSAPPSQVERALRFRGVDVDELIREVSALARERLRLLLERLEQLVQALAAAASTNARLPDWEIGQIAEDEWLAAVQELTTVDGPLASQALAAMATAAPDLSQLSRTGLLRKTLDEDLTAQGDLPVARALLAVLRKAGWSLEKRVKFAQAGLLCLPADLADHQEACGTALNIAVVAALAKLLASDEWADVDEIEGEVDMRGRTMRERLHAPPVETDGEFLDHVASAPGVSVDVAPPGRLLVEWDEEMWQRLRQAFSNAANSHLAQFPDNLRDLETLLRRCLEDGSLEPLREHCLRQRDERTARIRELERGIETGELAFDPEALLATTAAPRLGEPTSSKLEVGRGIGSGDTPAVTVNQALRGRLAELFVLEVCWHRFLNLDAGARAGVLDAVAACRRDGPGDVPWGTAVSWRRLEKKLNRHREALIACPADAYGVSPELAKLFKELIEVADERGPGFDVLDPSGVWGMPDDAPSLPRRVEIKAILPPEASLDGHPVVLSTNEFHRARQHPESYVLRLIYVPHNHRDLASVRWACDITDPVVTLGLEEKIVSSVRSGSFPFIVRLRSWKIDI